VRVYRFLCRPSRSEVGGVGERESEHRVYSSPCSLVLFSPPQWPNPTSQRRGGGGGGIVIMTAAFHKQQEQRSCGDGTICCCCFCLLPAERSRLNVGSGDPQQQSGILVRHLSKSASDLSTTRGDDHDRRGGRLPLAKTSTAQAQSAFNVPQVTHKTHHSFFSTLKVRQDRNVLIGHVISVPLRSV